MISNDSTVDQLVTCPKDQSPLRIQAWPKIEDMVPIGTHGVLHLLLAGVWSVHSISRDILRGSVQTDIGLNHHIVRVQVPVSGLITCRCIS